jgi:hypothetical protein
MSDIFISDACENRSKTKRPEISDTPIEIKIPQRMVNLPVVPASILRNIALFVMTVVVLAAGGYFYSFLLH